MDYVIIILILIIAGLIWVVYKTYQKSERDKKEILALRKEGEEYKKMGNG